MKDFLNGTEKEMKWNVNALIRHKDYYYLY